MSLWRMKLETVLLGNRTCGSGSSVAIEPFQFVNQLRPLTPEMLSHLS